MIQEIVMHTEKLDILDGYIYDAETPDVYVYRHKYTGKEIHIAKVPPLYVNVQDYIDKVLDKIRAEIDEVYEELDGCDPDSLGTFACRIDDILDKYKADRSVEDGNVN